MRFHRLISATGGVLTALTFAAVAHADARPSAILTSSSPVTDASFASIAAAGSIVVAAGSVTDVWSEPPTGWASAGPSAVLADPSLPDGSATSVATDGGTVVATMSGAEDVFAEPSSGWAGTVAPTAHLVDGAGRPVSGGVVQGGTIAAVSSTGDAVDVFTEPAGGWAGTVTPTAQLTLPSGLRPTARLAISRSSVFVPTRRGTSVFTEPSGGWVDAQTPSALLHATGDVSAFGTSVLVDGLVFTESAGGWPSAAPATATIVPRPAAAAALSQSAAVAASLFVPASGGCDDVHLCTVTIRAVTRHATGWSGTTLATVVTHDEDAGSPPALAISGDDVLQTDGNELKAFPLPASAGTRLTPPVALAAHVAGIERGTPSIHFRLRSGPGQPPITRLQIHFLPGLLFTRNRSRLDQGVRLQGRPTHPRVSRRGSHRTLTVTSPGRHRTLRVSIGRGALELSRAVVRHFRHDRRATLRVPVLVSTAFASWKVIVTVPR